MTTCSRCIRHFLNFAEIIVFRLSVHRVAQSSTLKYSYLQKIYVVSLATGPMDMVAS